MKHGKSKCSTIDRDRDIQFRCSVGRGRGVFAAAIFIGAGHRCCGNLNQSYMLDMFYITSNLIDLKEYNHADRLSSISKYDIMSKSSSLTDGSTTRSCGFQEEEVGFYTPSFGYAWVWKIEFISEENPMKSHNGLHVHNNGANIAIPLGSKTESLHSTSERGTLCGNLVSLAHQWPGCQKVQG